MYSVLIVEDEKMERDFLKSVITKELAQDDLVYACEDGVQATSMARKYKPDIIFMDIFLPELDGMGATEEIQKFLPDACVCILSACSDFSYAQKAVSLHVFKYMLKPIRPSEFKMVLTQMMDVVDERRQRESSVGSSETIEKEQEPFIEESVKLYTQAFPGAADAPDSLVARVHKPAVFQPRFQTRDGSDVHAVHK